MPDRKNCPDCGASPGSVHEDGCDVALCAVTGQQRLLACGESGGFAAGECEHEEGTDCRTVWTGQWPGEQECAEYGWYARMIPGKGWVPCDSDHPEAVYDLNRLVRDAEWDRSRGRYVKTG